MKIRVAVPKAPSFPNPVDEYVPTNPPLWKAVLEVAQGKRQEHTLGDRTIHAPNNGRGFSWPSPQGSAWAVKQYKGFGGGWKGRKEARLQEDLERKVKDSLYGIRLDKSTLDETDKARLADLAHWFRQNFRVDTAKTPRGQKRLKEEAARFLSVLETYSRSGGTTYTKALDGVLNIWKGIERDLPALVKHFTSEGYASQGKEEALSEIQGQHATYFNRATMSNANFKKYAKRLDQLFGELRGWRKKALRGNLKVVFMGAGAMKSQGKYRESSDEMWVKATPKILQRASRGYASPEYIIIHELGHRYEKFNRPPQDFDRMEWKTTRYSWNDGESFAELFALGHFDLKGPWSQDTVHRFEDIMSGHERTAKELRDYLLEGPSQEHYAEQFEKLSRKLSSEYDTLSLRRGQSPIMYTEHSLTPQQKRVLAQLKTGAILTTGVSGPEYRVLKGLEDRGLVVLAGSNLEKRFQYWEIA
jgi:hypothetical protein